MPEHTIAENLQRLIDAKTAISSAITAKGGTVGADDGLEEFAADIATIPSGGGGGSSSNDVRFLDYDGTVVQTYSAADFANLSELPANPTHEGLTAQGWNWSLADAKAYVASYGKLNIGQMYITSDGKTRLYYVIPKDSLTLELQLTLDKNTELDIDWGDNSEHTAWTNKDGSSKSHTYSDASRYTIAITVVSGGFSYKSSGNEDYTLKKVEFGSNVTSIGNDAFYYCYSLSSITIPDSVTDIGYSAFYYCYSLSSITIPNSVTSIRGTTFHECYSLSSIAIPNSVTYIESSIFTYCSALTSITIPSNVTSIETATFQACSALTSITIPNSVTSIGSSAFHQCFALTSVTIPDSVTSIGDYAFQDCYSLTSITIPNGVTNIAYQTFYDCYALSSVTIPDSVTSISGQAFDYCYSLTSITIPNSVTSIEDYAFSSCYSLSSITFEPTTPPTLYEDLGFPTTCIIRVPQGTLSDYTSVPNYPDPEYYIYEEY